MKLGIVGLPNVGKSTLFNAITSTKNAEAANYPFCTIEPNSGIVAVPDKRLDKLAEIWQTNKKTPAIVELTMTTLSMWWRMFPRLRPWTPLPTSMPSTTS